jgi:hypothetical protein
VGKKKKETKEAWELRQYKAVYEHAIECVDRVFQIDSRKPPPLLPNFARLGECKFRAVIRLAEDYLRLQRVVCELERRLDLKLKNEIIEKRR